MHASCFTFTVNLHPFVLCLALFFKVVGPTNELVEAKLQLKVETQRILSQMTLKASRAFPKGCFLQGNADVCSRSSQMSIYVK